jgi:hypothetical protein
MPDTAFARLHLLLPKGGYSFNKGRHVRLIFVFEIFLIKHASTDLFWKKRIVFDILVRVHRFIPLNSTGTSSTLAVAERFLKLSAHNNGDPLVPNIIILLQRRPSRNSHGSDPHCLRCTGAFPLAVPCMHTQFRFEGLFVSPVFSSRIQRTELEQ